VPPGTKKKGKPKKSADGELWFSCFSAKFDSKCPDCGKKLPEGTMVWGHKSDDANWYVVCEDCYMKNYKGKSVVTKKTSNNTRENNALEAIKLKAKWA